MDDIVFSSTKTRVSPAKIIKLINDNYMNK